MLTKAQAGDLVRLYEQLGGQVKQLETPFTVANPGGNDSQGPFKSQTQARQVARVMWKEAKMCICGIVREQAVMVSLNHPTDIPANR